MRNERGAIYRFERVAALLIVFDDPRQRFNRRLLGRRIVHEQDDVLVLGRFLCREVDQVVGGVIRAVAARDVPVVLLVATRLHFAHERRHDARRIVLGN